MSESEDLALAQSKMMPAQHVKDIADITESGRDTYGADQFNDAVSRVEQAMGNRAGELGILIKEFDDPAAALMHLASNEARLANMAKMPTARILADLAAI